MMNDDQFYNLVNLLALGIGVMNLQENREQTAYNDVHASNQKQAEYLLGEIGKQFESQNKKIDEILERLERIESNDNIRKNKDNEP